MCCVTVDCVSLLLPGQGCCGLRHVGPLFLHRGWSRGEEHLRPLPWSDGSSRHPAALRQGQQNVSGHHRWSLSWICGQPTAGLQVGELFRRECNRMTICCLCKNSTNRKDNSRRTASIFAAQPAAYQMLNCHIYF